MTMTVLVQRRLSWRMTTTVTMNVLILLLLLAMAATIAAEDVPTTTLSNDQVQATLDQVSNLLQQQEPLSLPDVDHDIKVLQESIQKLESTLLHELRPRQTKVEELVLLHNAKQLQHFVGDRLRPTLERAVTRLQESAQAPMEGPEQEELLSSVPTDETAISLEQLHARLDRSVIVQDSEQVLVQWMLEIVRDELERYRQAWLEPLLPMTTSNNHDSDGTVSCRTTTTSHVVPKVQQALRDHAVMADGRRVDHARGARVVHLLTSETYEPPSETTWGDAWWRRYIPQDWESVLLPEGWEEWTATSLPSLVYHSTKFMQGEVAPPETILQKSVLPGACWPMEGKSGMVTLKLKYPVLVEEITIDHVSKDIIPSGWRNSAPKKIKIVGYPPCHQGDKYCESLGFDRENPIDIAEFIYDVEGPSMQTFDSYYGKAMKDMSAAAQSVHNQVEEEESGSCSAEAAACTTPPRIFVAGVAVKVQDNWGQKRYTCLYRVRIHGEAA